VFRRDYSSIRVPVLALMDGVMTTEELLAATGYRPTPAERATIDRFMARGRIVFGRWTDKLVRHVPNARVIWYPLAGHYVHLTRPTDVLREIHAFVAGLESRRESCTSCFSTSWSVAPSSRCCSGTWIGARR
jgi:hypothetical protein